MTRLATAILLLALSETTAASETSPGEEAAIAAAEEAQEQQAGAESLRHSFTGKVVLTAPREDAPDIVGVFLVNGTAHLLKVSGDAVLTDLRKVNGQTATLSGRPRVHGKYFVASAVERAGAPPVQGRPRTGL